MQAFIPIVITIICWAVFFISFSYDRSRYRNCPLLFIALISLAPTAFALDCRQMGFKCTGIGSHVALYYWPSAVIREYLAIHAEKKHLFYFIAGWLLCILPIIAIALYGR